MIADSHVFCGSEEAEIFFRMLDRLAALKPAGILFLGDVFELWIALKGYETPDHLRFVQWCRTHSAEFEVGFIEGNHEFFVGSAHRDAFSWVTDDRHELDPQVCLLHGDLINRKDWKYLLLRRLIRNPFTKFLLRLFAATIGPRVTDHIRLSLKTSNMQHKKYLPRADFDAYAAASASRHVIATGHFHVRETFQTVSGATVQILPAWTPDGEIGVLDVSGSLACVPWRSLAEG